MTDEIINDNETIQSQKINGFYFSFLWFAGVLLPAAAFFIELFAHWCAKDFFDPMPTWWHVLFVFFVPVTNLQILLAINKGGSERLIWLGYANAAAICISLFYTIIFAPLTPIAVFAIIALFLGLLPLAPLLSLIAGLLLRRQLKKIAPADKPPALGWKGLAAAFLFVLAAVTLAEIPFTLTKIGVRRASSENVEESNAGINFLRKFGSREYLLRLCYNRSGMVTTDLVADLFTSQYFFNPTENSSLRDQSQKAFYRLTGVYYRQMPTPREVRNWGRFEEREFIDETDASRLNQGLSLTGSQMDGSVDGDAALGYLEWTLVFKNEKTWQQEAISQIQLPPNAVVSRLTLWIKGEEREAAFAKSAKVIEAYNAVTARRRDPALVTTTGKDRVQLKCFPIEPNGEMKVRIGITVPLVLENESNSVMPLPYFQDRNFAVPTEHFVWIESKKPLEIANAAFVKEQRDNVFGVRGKLKNADLIKIGSPVRAGKSANVKTAWAKDSKNPQFVVKQEIREAVKPKVGRLIFVVDASAAMRDFQKPVANVIRNFAPETETVLILTGGNGLNSDFAAPKSFNGNPAQIAEKISNATFDGGTDGVPAIETAWELAQEKPHSAIVWIHAPQSVEITLPQNLNQFWTRRPNSAAIYSLQTRTGKDVVERVLSESNAVSSVVRFGDLQTDLSRLLNDLTAQKTVYEAVRTAENTRKNPTSVNAKETSQHLVRLWANDEVKRLLINNENEKAIDLAVNNQLVTPVSGAVVLETQQQYDQFGLRPVEPNSVPTIPEPEEYLLFGIVLAVFLWFVWRFRRQNSGTEMSVS